MHILRRVVFVAATVLFGVALALVTKPPVNPAVPPLPEKAPHLLVLAVEGLWTFLVWAADYPIYFGVAVAVFVVPWFLATLISVLPRRIHKDPQRLYTAAQRRVASDRAGGRCEMEGFFFTRCKRPGTAGDHWFPHSKGGATTMSNCVLACTSCNSSKGAKVPTLWETLRLEWRRSRYFPAGIELRPGDKVRV